MPTPEITPQVSVQLYSIHEALDADLDGSLGKLAEIGFNVVIYPVTLLRIAMGAIERGLRTLADDGTQRDLVPQMQTRAELYDLLGYAGYTAFDADIFAFDLPTGHPHDQSTQEEHP